VQGISFYGYFVCVPLSGVSEYSPVPSVGTPLRRKIDFLGNGTVVTFGPPRLRGTFPSLRGGTIRSGRLLAAYPLHPFW